MTVTGSFISSDSVLRVGAYEGRVISATASEAIFEIPALTTSEVVGQYAELDKAEKIVDYTVISDGGSNQ